MKRMQIVNDENINKLIEMNNFVFYKPSLEGYQFRNCDSCQNSSGNLNVTMIHHQLKLLSIAYI